MRRKLLAVILIGGVADSCPAGAQERQVGFRLAPYLQNTTVDAFSVVWWSEDDAPGAIEWGRTSAYGSQTTSRPRRSAAITTVRDGVEYPTVHPYRHEVRLRGLDCNQRYFYRVTQGRSVWASHGSTAPGMSDAFTFVVAADPESKATEPKRSRIHRGVLDLTLSKNPRFIVYAGDLVDQGNAQDDWDSFWSDLLDTTPHRSIASSIPIYAALGNHEYDALNTTLGGNTAPYAQPHSEAGVAKFRAYFSFPSNDYSDTDTRHERYYSFRFGATTIVVLDTNNDSISSAQPKTNWDAGRWRDHPLVGETEPPEHGGQGWAPDIHGGKAGRESSRQYQWLANTLEKAADQSAFTFVVFHQAPYSSFEHGDPNDPQSGHPLRKLDPLFHRYGVTAVFSGHDEAYERSVTTDGAHTLHYYILPTIGDPTGLRIPRSNASWQRNHSRFIYPQTKRRHGYLSIAIEPTGGNEYLATITPFYFEPSQPDNADLHYDDVVRIRSHLRSAQRGE